jgi:hypothetical protein
MNHQQAESFASRLLVEGRDDFHIVSAICNRHNLQETFAIEDCDGIDNVFQQIPLRIKLKDKRLGILVDADINLSRRWQQVTNLLSPLGYRVSEHPSVEGTILTSDENECLVGIWLMPNNQASGMIEDFAQILIPQDNLLRSHAERIVSEIQDSGLAPFMEAHRSKALICTWLSWQESPGTPIGQAITKSYLDHNHELCLKFVDWLNALFN